MLLSDPRLEFAHDLIEYWSSIRGDALVPLEEDLDPAALTRCVPLVTTVVVGQPNVATMDFASPEISQRYGKEMHAVNLFSMIAPERRAIADEANRLFVCVPCGVFYRFAIAAGGTRIIETESLSLPLRRRGRDNPEIAISLSHDLGASVAAATSSAPRKIERVFAEFVDIGAGAPPFPSAARVDLSTVPQ
jgi:hypothetical protein